MESLGVGSRTEKGALRAPRFFLLKEQGRANVYFKKMKKSRSCLNREMRILFAKENGVNAAPWSLGLGGGRAGFSRQIGCSGREELNAAGWRCADGTISNLPLGSDGGIRPY